MTVESGDKHRSTLKDKEFSKTTVSNWKQAWLLSRDAMKSNMIFYRTEKYNRSLTKATW